MNGAEMMIIRQMLKTIVTAASLAVAAFAYAQTGFGPEVRVSNVLGPSTNPVLAASSAPDNLLHAVWTEYVNSGSPQIYYGRSPDNGNTWSPAVPVSQTPTAVVPMIGAGPNGVFVVWTDAVATGELFFRASLDGGVTWGAQRQLTNVGGYSRPSGVLVDSAGCIHVTWFDGRSGYGQNYHRMSCDSGASFSPEVNLSVLDPFVDYESPRLAEAIDGTLYLVMRSSKDGMPQQGWSPMDTYLMRSASIVRTGAPVNWRVNWLFPPQKISRGLPEELGNTYGAKVTAGTAGRMHVAYWLETAGNNLVYRRGYPKGTGWGPVIDVSQFGLNHLEFDGATADFGGFGLAEDTSNGVHVAFGENNHIREGFQVGSVFYRRSTDGGLTFGPRLQAATNTETMHANALYHNNRFHMIWADFRDSNQGAEIYYRNVDASGSASPLFLSATALTFPATPAGSTSAGQAVTVTNVGASPLTISSIATTGPFARTHTCGSLAPGASCAITGTFAPAVVGSASGAFSIAYSGTGSPATITLTGFGSFSLVDHYYRAILRRAPDAGGKVFWEDEVVRMQGLGVDVKEAYMVMAGYFFNSPEYIALATSDSTFVTDLYNTFFNRAPDAGGFSYWTGQLAAGLPRNIAMYGFLFSPEFGSFMSGLFGNTTSRAEIYAVVDYYRGVLNRLPDTAGFNFWLAQFRNAQCSGTNAAGAVYTAVDSISSQFLRSPEYAGRNRTNTEYVSDLYYAFLRRDGDLAGVNFWIKQLSTAAETREQLRRDFIASPEFTLRVNAIIAQGC